jgi:hypothetical protein
MPTMEDEDINIPFLVSIGLVDKEGYKMRNFKLRTISKAIRKNGWPQITGTYTMDEDGEATSVKKKVIGACALGQGALNLNVPAPVLHTYLNDLNLGDGRYYNCPADDNDLKHLLGSMVVHLNDDHKWSLDDIADWLDDLGAR